MEYSMWVERPGVLQPAYEVNDFVVYPEASDIGEDEDDFDDDFDDDFEEEMEEEYEVDNEEFPASDFDGGTKKFS
jgi:hypothetical protein